MKRAQESFQVTKPLYVVDDGPRKIKSIQFSLFSEYEILKLAEIEVYLGLYYESTKKPIRNGLLDPHMGPPNKNGCCEPCHGNFRECPGHYGYLVLALPVYNVGYLGTVVNILKCICKDCELLYLSGRPEKLLVSSIPVPPIAIHPSVFVDGGTQRWLCCLFWDVNFLRCTSLDDHVFAL